MISLYFRIYGFYQRNVLQCQCFPPTYFILLYTSPQCQHIHTLFCYYNQAIGGNVNLCIVILFYY